MPSARRKRLLVFLAVLAIFTVIYVTTGAQQTRSSPFYKRTMELMENRRVNGLGALQKGKTSVEALAGREIEGLGTAAKEILAAASSDEGDSAAGTDRLKEALKEAEVEAKKSADSKWKNVADAADLADKDKDKDKAKDAAAAAPAAQQPQREKTVAGRKKYPIPTDDTSPAAAAGSREDGVAHNVPHAGDQQALVPAKDDAAGGITQAAAELARLLTLSPVLIFSKSYCPYSHKAKHILLDNYAITPAPYVVELDQLEDGMGQRLQELLRERTGRGTVPNVMVGGGSIGGGDDVEEMWRSGRLKEVVEKAAGREVRSVVLKVKPEE